MPSVHVFDSAYFYERAKREASAERRGAIASHPCTNATYTDQNTGWRGVLDGGGTWEPGQRRAEDRLGCRSAAWESATPVIMFVWRDAYARSTGPVDDHFPVLRRIATQDGGACSAGILRWFGDGKKKKREGGDRHQAGVDARNFGDRRIECGEGRRP